MGYKYMKMIYNTKLDDSVVMVYEFSDSFIEPREFELKIYKLPESEKCELSISPIKTIVNYIFSACLVSPVPSFKRF